MKMFKKLMAVALVGVMAVSMLTGCAVSDAVAEKQVLNAMQTVVGADVTTNSDLKDAAKKAATEARKEAENKYGDEAAEAVAAFDDDVVVTKDGKDKTYKVAVVKYDKKDKAKDYASDLVDALDLTAHEKAKVGVNVFNKEYKKSADSKDSTKYYFVVAVVEKAD